MKSETEKQPTTIILLDERRRSKFQRLFAEQQEMEREDAFKAGEVGYLNKIAIQATLPYREPNPNLPAWGRRSGNVALAIQPGASIDVATGKAYSFGYPYGVIPRLTLAWLGREISRQQSREIDLSNSLHEFMSDIGMESRTGGKNGSISAVKKQMQRLFAARISLIELEAGNTDLTDYQSARFMDIARDATFWWSAKPGQASLFDTRIVLGERFYEAFKGGIPIDLRAMRALSQSPLELDLYCWLCYRLAYLRSPTTVPWEALQAQFGTITQESAKFRWMVRKALTSIAVVYPGAKFDSQGYTGLLLFPSAPAIAHKINRA